MIVTGVLGIICCGFLAPYTWIKSNQAIQAINSGYGNLADKGTFNIARILGIIGTALWILGTIARVATIGRVATQPATTGPNTSIGAPSNP